MRKRISEQNIFPDFNLYEEYQKIEELLSEKKVAGTISRYRKIIHHYFTLEEHIQHLCFNDWNLRGTFFTIQEMRKGLGIEKGFVDSDNIDQNRILDFLQYAMNCVDRASTTIKTIYGSLLSDDTVITLLKDNIKLLVEKLNCSLELDSERQEYYIVYNNSTATAVSKYYPDVQDSISEYARIDNRGDLKRKGEILCTLFKKLESVEAKLKANNFVSIVSDTTVLFNKSGIRHWVAEDKIACATFLQMDKKELEEWYDKIFNMFLTCMVLAKYVDDIPAIKDIKRAIGE